MRTTVHLEWQPSQSNDVAGYRLTWRATGVAEKAITVTAFPTNLTLNVDLVLNKHYTFEVSAYDRAGNQNPRRLIAGVMVYG